MRRTVIARGRECSLAQPLDLGLQLQALTREHREAVDIGYSLRVVALDQCDRAGMLSPEPKVVFDDASPQRNCTRDGRSQRTRPEITQLAESVDAANAVAVRDGLVGSRCAARGEVCSRRPAVPGRKRVKVAGRVDTPVAEPDDWFDRVDDSD
jgi:hypothetical protein